MLPFSFCRLARGRAQAVLCRLHNSRTFFPMIFVYFDEKKFSQNY